MLSDRQKNELNEKLNLIDNELTEKHVPIPARPLVTSLKYQQALGISFVFPSEVSSYIEGWYSKKYGLIKDTRPIGSSVICISGHVFAVELPTILGQAKIRPLTHIKGLTEELWQSQSKKDQARIVETIVQIIRRFQVISNYLEAVGGDLTASVTHLLGPSGDYGLSKWASFQAAEKIIKSSLKTKNVKYPFTHDIDALRLLAAQNGLPLIPEDWIAKVKTTPGVRYGNQKISVSDAINSHYASIMICAMLADPENAYDLHGDLIKYPPS